MIDMVQGSLSWENGHIRSLSPAGGDKVIRVCCIATGLGLEALTKGSDYTMTILTEIRSNGAPHSA